MQSVARRDERHPCGGALRLFRPEPFDADIQIAARGDAGPVSLEQSFGMSFSAREFRQGLVEVLPIVVAATPIGLLWGTLAAGKGLSAFETWLMSASVFAGAAQFVAIEVWRDPVPWLLLTVTALIEYPACADGGFPVASYGSYRQALASLDDVPDGG